MRAGLARLSKTDYAPLPTVYDGLFPNGTFLTAPVRRRDDTRATDDVPREPRDERS